MTDWYCNHCGTKIEIVDADTKYLEFEGMQDTLVCESCKEWWIEAKIAQKVVKGEADCEAKMA